MISNVCYKSARMWQAPSMTHILPGSTIGWHRLYHTAHLEDTHFEVLIEAERALIRWPEVCVIEWIGTPRITFLKITRIRKAVLVTEYPAIGKTSITYILFKNMFLLFINLHNIWLSYHPHTWFFWIKKTYFSCTTRCSVLSYMGICNILSWKLNE